MKWISVNTGTLNETFELLEENKKLAGITFSKRTGFARVVSDLGKRIFSFEKRGFLQAREIIKNEYGVKMGEVEDLKPGTGHVELDGKKYSFVYNDSGELKVYDELMQKNLLTCNFNTITGSLTKTKPLSGSKFASLLLVLCWYAFQPQTLSPEAAA